MSTTAPSLQDLSDSDLLARAELLRGEERVITAQLIWVLAEVERRALYLREGVPSLLAYCQERLKLSEYEAYLRMQVARASVSYPEIPDMIADGRLTLTSVALLARHLNTHNYRALLDGAVHKSKREVIEQIAALHPQPALPDCVWQLRTIVPVGANGGTPATEPVPAAPNRHEVSTEVSAARDAFERSTFTQLAPERYKLQVTVSREAYEAFCRIRHMSRHIVPNGDPGVLIERALFASLRDLERRRTARAERPSRTVPCNSGSRYVPAHVRRAVYERDGDQCAFIGATGRCLERGFLELHHVIPYAEGGETTVANMELRCRAHNAFESELYFGTG